MIRDMLSPYCSRKRVWHVCAVVAPFHGHTFPQGHLESAKMDVRFSITIRQHKSLHNLIEAIPEDAWTPIPYWMDGAADVAETTCINDRTY